MNQHFLILFFTFTSLVLAAEADSVALQKQIACYNGITQTFGGKSRIDPGFSENTRSRHTLPEILFAPLTRRVNGQDENGFYVMTKQNAYFVPRQSVAGRRTITLFNLEGQQYGIETLTELRPNANSSPPSTEMYAHLAVVNRIFHPGEHRLFGAPETKESVASEVPGSSSLRTTGFASVLEAALTRAEERYKDLAWDGQHFQKKPWPPTDLKTPHLDLVPAELLAKMRSQIGELKTCRSELEQNLQLNSLLDQYQSVLERKIAEYERLVRSVGTAHTIPTRRTHSNR